MILFDTDVCLSFLAGNRRVFEQYHDISEEIGIPAPCVQELFYLAGKSSEPEKNIDLVETFLVTIQVIHPDLQVLRYAANLQRRMDKDGHRASCIDVLLFSMSKVYNAKLVTAHSKRYLFHVKQ